MEKFNINNLVFQRAVAKNIISESEIVLQKINKSFLTLSDEYFEAEKQLKNVGDISSIFNHSKKLDDISKKIIANLAVKDRLQNLIEKNKERVIYLNSEIKYQLIQEFDVPEKQIEKTVFENNFNVNDENLNINSNINGNLQIFFNNSLLFIKNGTLDLTKTQNVEALSHFEEKYLYMVLDKYPKCLANLSNEILLNTKLKLKLLTYIANTTNQMLKDKSIYEINEYFGGVLDIKIGQKIDFKKYVSEVNNLFNVKINKHLIEKYPNYKDLIVGKIKCNVNSVFLPESLRSQINVDVLSVLFDNLASV